MLHGIFSQTTLNKNLFSG